MNIDPRVVHVVIDAAPNHTDATAWVSAAAAVVQAIAAGLAILYSGKLARDAADRERAADEAAQRRIREAADAAQQQRDADARDAEWRTQLQAAQQFNQPIDKAIQLGEAALAEFGKFLSELNSELKADYQRQVWPPSMPHALFLREQSTSLYDSAPDGIIAAAIRSLVNVTAPFTSMAAQATEWIISVRNKIAGIKAALEVLQKLRITLPERP